MPGIASSPLSTWEEAEVLGEMRPARPRGWMGTSDPGPAEPVGSPRFCWGP